MEQGESVFGIDFGTTNTRVAHYDGKTMHMVPIYDDRGVSYSMPTQVNYEDGRTAAFGYSALQRRQGAAASIHQMAARSRRSGRGRRSSDGPRSNGGRLFYPSAPGCG